MQNVCYFKLNLGEEKNMKRSIGFIGTKDGLEFTVVEENEGFLVQLDSGVIEAAEEIYTQVSQTVCLISNLTKKYNPKKLVFGVSAAAAGIEIGNYPIEKKTGIHWRVNNNIPMNPKNIEIGYQYYDEFDRLVIVYWRPTALERTKKIATEIRIATSVKTMIGVSSLALYDRQNHVFGPVGDLTMFVHLDGSLIDISFSRGDYPLFQKTFFLEYESARRNIAISRYAKPGKSVNDIARDVIVGMFLFVESPEGGKTKRIVLSGKRDQISFLSQELRNCLKVKVSFDQSRYVLSHGLAIQGLRQGCQFNLMKGLPGKMYPFL
jgi:hypothetical protein